TGKCLSLIASTSSVSSSDVPKTCPEFSGFGAGRAFDPIFVSRPSPVSRPVVSTNEPVLDGVEELLRDGDAPALAVVGEPQVGEAALEIEVGLRQRWARTAVVGRSRRRPTRARPDAHKRAGAKRRACPTHDRSGGCQGPPGPGSDRHRA